MEKLRIKLDFIISPILYVFNALLFPRLISELRMNLRVYKECANYIKSKIQTNPEFKKFLDDNEFDEAWFGRLYSLQKLDPKLGTFDDEALQNYVMDLVSKKWGFLVNQGFIEILIMRTKMIDTSSYVLILEIANFNAIKSILYHMIFSVILWFLIIRIAVVFYSAELLNIFHHIKHFVTQIF